LQSRGIGARSVCALLCLPPGLAETTHLVTEEQELGAVRRILTTILLAVAVLILDRTSSAVAAPQAELWGRWEMHDALSRATIDHGVWGDLLQRRLVRGDDGINRVDYTAFSRDDKAALGRYIQGLAALPISSYNRTEQMAYWINLYNALTVEVVLDHYPVDSIREIDISPGLFSDGPWGKKLIEVEGEQLSLDDIEHRILRPIWRDPRIHYAVNCASLGCPDLQIAPFRGATIESQLDAAARVYVNHPRGVLIENDDLLASSIYDWFMDDFGASERDVIQHLRSYADTELQAALRRFTTIDEDRYDWALNDADRS
jgi:hypothetical protein